MSSKLKSKEFLLSQFGLHQGHLGHLPTESELAAIKTLAHAMKYPLVTLDVSTLIQTAEQHGAEWLEIQIPTLGFTDPVCDFEIAPKFAVPLVVNNYVAPHQHPSQRVFSVMARDISGAIYPLKFDAAGRVDYPQIASSEVGAIFTTLTHLHYRLSCAQFQKGQGLYPVRDKQYDNKIVFLLPQHYAAFILPCELQIQDQTILRKEYIVIPPPHAEQPLQVQSHWQGNQERGQLDIQYQFSAEAKSWVDFEGKLTLDLPDAKGLAFELYGQEQWFETHHDKKPQLSCFYGLSPRVLYTLLENLLPFDEFDANLKSSAFCLPFDTVACNRFDEQPQVRRKLYQFMLSGVVNRSVPLYSLKYFSKGSAVTFDTFVALDVTKWPLSDQVVFRKIVDNIAAVHPEIEVVWDTIDSYLAFGPGVADGKLLMNTQGGILAKNPEILGQFKVSRFGCPFPIETTKTQTLDPTALQYTPVHPDGISPEVPDVGGEA